MGALAGRTALITGAASGLGREAAAALAGLGARVVLADRNAARGEAARDEILRAGGAAEFHRIDLADLRAVREFAQAWQGPLDLLLNNAGLLPPLQREQGAEGLELGFSVSVAGHFALTGLLLPALLCSEAPRVVTTSSIAHAAGRIDFDDLGITRDYDPMRAYSAAKLGALLHALELDRRARAAGVRLVSAAAHPGISRTAIGEGWSAPPQGWRDRLARFAFGGAMRWLSQSAQQGAAPLVHAASAPDVTGGEYYGPGGFAQWRGAPVRVRPSARARDAIVAARLWERLEALTGVRYVWPK